MLHINAIFSLLIAAGFAVAGFYVRELFWLASCFAYMAVLLEVAARKVVFSQQSPLFKEPVGRRMRRTDFGNSPWDLAMLERERGHRGKHRFS